MELLHHQGVRFVNANQRTRDLHLLVFILSRACLYEVDPCTRLSHDVLLMISTFTDQLAHLVLVEVTRHNMILEKQLSVQLSASTDHGIDQAPLRIFGAVTWRRMVRKHGKSMIFPVLMAPSAVFPTTASIACTGVTVMEVPSLFLDSVSGLGATSARGSNNLLSIADWGFDKHPLSVPTGTSIYMNYLIDPKQGLPQAFAC
mmetsp:Transcript_78570/g.136200  ORF Transcript_78570/g.136200 Transcript_78570/m.136200 type:complete len:202 (+) Transcript_78570:210-815(+)